MLSLNTGGFLCQRLFDSNEWPEFRERMLNLNPFVCFHSTVKKKIIMKQPPFLSPFLPLLNVSQGKCKTD